MFSFCFKPLRRLTSHRVVVREVAINAELIEEERRERERAANLPASIFHAVKYALGQRSQESSRHYLHDTPRSLPSSASLGITAAQEPSNGAAKASRQGAAAAAPPRYYTNAGAVSTSPSRSQRGRQSLATGSDGRREEERDGRWSG